jgi:hypothetical protein
MKESDIQRQILDYLKIKKIFAWRNNSVGIYDPIKRIYRKNPQTMQGVSDIIGIYKTKPMFIEIKSEKGIVSSEQEYFIERIKQEGGIAFVARSVEDVISYLAEYDLSKSHELS